MKKDKQTEQIIDILFSSESISEVEMETIRHWLADEDNSELKDKLLLRKFLELHKAKKKKNYVDEMWPAFAERHNMDIKLINSTVPGKVVRMPLRKRMAFKIVAVLLPLLVIGVALALLVNEAGDTTKKLTSATETPMVSITAEAANEVTLPDGSTAKLKPGSVLAYSEDFTNDRSVTLDGEAYFSVVEDVDRPFTVGSGDLTITVLGTEFNVMTSGRAGEGEVTLASGSVSVSAHGVDGTTVLSPGQQLVYDREMQTVELSEVDEMELMRLKGMGLVFDNSLEEIFRICERYFKVDILFDETGFSDLRQMVIFDPDQSLDHILEVLQTLTGEFQYEIENDTVIITTH